MELVGIFISSPHVFPLFSATNDQNKRKTVGLSLTIIGAHIEYQSWLSDGRMMFLTVVSRGE